MNKYSTIVLFAARQGKKVITGRLFETLLRTIMESFCVEGVKLSVKGVVFDSDRRKINPRGGPWSIEKLDAWVKSVNEGRLVDFNLSHHDAGSSDQDPSFYVNLTHFGEDGPGESDVDEDGFFFPPLSLTIAIPPDRVTGNELAWDDLCITLAVQMKAVFGFMESKRNWGVPSGLGGLGELMDYRGHDVPNLEYGSGERGRMDELVSRLRWRCILRKAHLSVSLDELRSQPFVERAIEGKGGIIFVAFQKDPEVYNAIAKKAAPFFNFVPPEGEDD